MDHLGDDLTPVLVTGASGYLGSRVLSLLRERGIEAVGTARSPSDGLSACDLTDPSAVYELMCRVRPATVVHCAAIVPRSAADYSDANTAMTSLRMVETLLRQKPSRFVFSSSMTVYSDSILIAREEDATTAGNGYAAHKLEAETLLLRQSEMSVAILRLPGLFGPPRSSGALFNAALAFAGGNDFRLTDPVPKWSALHVDDAAEAIVKALRLPRGKYLMNVGYPGRMAIADAVAQLAEMFGRTWLAPTPRWFEFDLSRLNALLGPVSNNFGLRLRQVADWARIAAMEASND